jgi:hypothetical protein
MAAETAAHVQAIAAGNHDVKEKESRSLPFGVRNEIGWSVKQARMKAGGFQVVLHKARNVSIVFQYEYSLAQTVSPRPPAVVFQDAEAARNRYQINAIRQRYCKRLMNLAVGGSAHV